MAYRSAGEKRMYTKLCSHWNMFVFHRLSLTLNVTHAHTYTYTYTHTHTHTHLHLHTLTHTQGDLPVGTLVSDPFKIDGTKISFLVGGGCNILEECVNQCTTLREENYD